MGRQSRSEGVCRSDRVYHLQLALTLRAAGVEVMVLNPRMAKDFGRALATKQGGPLHVGRVRSTLEQAAQEADTCGMARLVTETRSALDRIAS